MRVIEVHYYCCCRSVLFVALEMHYLTLISSIALDDQFYYFYFVAFGGLIQEMYVLLFHIY